MAACRKLRKTFRCLLPRRSRTSDTSELDSAVSVPKTSKCELNKFVTNFEEYVEEIPELLPTTVEFAVSVPKTSKCELNEFVTNFEEYVEEIPERLPTTVEYACRAVDTLLNFRSKLDEFASGQSQVDRTVESVKERVERALRFAQKYRDACVKAAAFGSDKSEIGAIKREIQNNGSFGRLMIFVQRMTTLFESCKTRLDNFMSANKSAKDFIHASVEKMEKQRQLAQEQMDKSIATAVAGGAAATLGLFVAGPLGAATFILGSMVGAGGTAVALVNAHLMHTYSKGLQEITVLDRDLNRVRMNVDALRQKMSDCHNHLCRAGRHHAVTQAKQNVTKVTKKSVCHFLDCMCRNFGEVQRLAAM